MTIMQAKDIHIALKREDGISYLMERFGFTSEEELFEVIRKVAPKGKDLIKGLKRQRKFNIRRDRPNDDLSLANEDETALMEATADEHENACEEPESDIQLIGRFRIEDMQRLKAEESELSRKVRELELEHKKLVSQRRDAVAGLRKAKDNLSELRRLLNIQEGIVMNLYEEYESCASQMENLNRERRDFQAWLNDVRKTISEFNKVTIFVYEDGTIEVENAEIPNISENAVLTELGNLLSFDGVEGLTIREARTMAKLRVIINFLKEDKRETEIVLDSPRFQKIWQSFLS